MYYTQDASGRSGKASPAIPLIFVVFFFGIVSLQWLQSRPTELRTARTPLRQIKNAALVSSVLTAVPASAALASNLPAHHPSLVTLVAEDPVLGASDYVQLGFLALLLPVAGYVSWQFGLQKSREAALQSKEEFEKALKQGTAVKVSPSGMATIMGFPLASDQGWKILSKQLRERSIKSISGQDLIKLADPNVTVIDVRSSEKFATASIPGSINVPLFQPITGWTPFKIARRLQFAFFGISGTECNSNFINDLQSKLANKPNEVIFVDDSVRGTLEPTFAFPEGKPGHALMAIYLALELAKLQNPMRYLEGGINSYADAGGDAVMQVK